MVLSTAFPKCVKSNSYLPGLHYHLNVGATGRGTGLGG